MTYESQRAYMRVHIALAVGNCVAMIVSLVLVFAGTPIMAVFAVATAVVGTICASEAAKAKDELNNMRNNV